MKTTSRFTAAVSCALAVWGSSGAAATATAAQEAPSAAVAPVHGDQTQAPITGKEWRLRGDELLQEGQLQQALEAYRKAEQMGAGDEELVMTIAQIYRQLNRDRDAFREYARNRSAVNPELRASACYGMNDLNWAKYKFVPTPYFVELGLYGGWQNVNELAYFAAPARAGVMLGDTHPTTFYGFSKIGRDSESGWVGPELRQYSENLGIFGVGAQQLVSTRLGLKAVGEIGVAHDYVWQERDRNRRDVRAGLELWQEWNTVRFCESRKRYPFRFLMTAWGELMYYSRYNDATVLGADLRPGVRLRETDQGAIDLLAIGGFYFDSKAKGSFQYGEAGAALRWIPDHQSPFRISFRVVETYNNDGPTGAKWGIELEHYLYW